MKKQSAKRDFKQLAIDHVEKVIFGVVVLFVLLAVSPVMTLWSRYAKTPTQMTTLANESADKITRSRWPKDEATKYPLTDTIGKSVEELQRPLNISPFDYLGDGLTFPLYPKQEPIKEPKFLAVEDPIANAGRALIALRSEGSEDGTGSSEAFGPLAGKASSEAAQKEDQSDIPARFRRRTTSTTAGEEGLGLGGIPDAGLPTGIDPTISGGATAGMEQVASFTNARGMRFVVIRAVFPLLQEIAEFRQALHAANDSDVAGQVVVIDFEIERQLKGAGANPWGSPWVKLDIQRTKDVIDEIEDFEPDVMPTGITDSTITMGLLQRVVGEWGNLATHPRVENYKLSSEERQEQERLNERTVIEWQKYQKNRPKPLRRRGFSDRQRDLRGMASDLRQSQQGLYDTVLRETVDDLDPKKMRRQLKNELDQQTAAGRLLLFRYFDFDVEPRQTYRYRIRLELANPNYETPVEQLQNPDSAKGQTRKTPWSKPTPPTTVPGDTHYFLTRVIPARGTGEPTAAVDVYEWFSVFGTTAKSAIETHFGGFVLGLQKAWVLRPAQPSFDEEKGVPFFTPDMLVDVSAGARLRRTDHPDLQLPRAISGGRGLTVDQMLMIDPYGQFIWTDPVSTTLPRRRAEKILGWEHGPWEDLKNKTPAADANNPLDAGSLDAATLGIDPRALTGKKGRKKRRRSALRK